jgi:dimethylargininase
MTTNGKLVTSARPALSRPFVSSDAAALRAVLAFAPTAELPHFAPLHAEPNAIAERALEQFKIFTGRLAAAGVEVIEAGSELAALSPFGADGAVVFPDGAFLMRPSDVRGRGAMAALEAALGAAGVPIVGRIEAPGLLDGGDVLFSGGTLYLGVTAVRQAETGLPRTARGNVLGREQLAAYARANRIAVVEVKMAAEVRRLRSVASIIDTKTVVAAAGLVDVSAFAGLDCIDVPRGEDYAAGVLALGNRRILTNLRFRESLPLLRKAKTIVDAIDVWEFGKVGATPSSMVLALKRG